MLRWRLARDAMVLIILSLQHWLVVFVCVLLTLSWVGGWF